MENQVSNIKEYVAHAIIKYLDNYSRSRDLEMLTLKKRLVQLEDGIKIAKKDGTIKECCGCGKIVEWGDDEFIPCDNYHGVWCCENCSLTHGKWDGWNTHVWFCDNCD